MDESQITGTASSYARKYALNGLFAIDDTKDADTDEHVNQVNNTPKKPNVQQLSVEETALRLKKKIESFDNEKDLDEWCMQKSVVDAQHRVLEGSSDLHNEIMDIVKYKREELAND